MKNIARQMSGPLIHGATLKACRCAGWEARWEGGWEGG